MDQWYKGEDGLVKKCPMCRGDRGFADTSKVLGIDEFLVGVGGILHVPPPPSSHEDLDLGDD